MVGIEKRKEGYLGTGSDKAGSKIGWETSTLNFKEKRTPISAKALSGLCLCANFCRLAAIKFT